MRDLINKALFAACGVLALLMIVNLLFGNIASAAFKMLVIVALSVVLGLINGGQSPFNP